MATETTGPVKLVLSKEQAGVRLTALVDQGEGLRATTRWSEEAKEAAEQWQHEVSHFLGIAFSDDRFKREFDAVFDHTWSDDTDERYFGHFVKTRLHLLRPIARSVKAGEVREVGTVEAAAAPEPEVGPAEPSFPLPTPPLTEVRLKHFKAAFRPKAVKLRPFTVIIGRNGSGKSTLLEALQWIDSTMRDHAMKACERYLGVQDLLNLRATGSPRSFSIECRWKEHGVVPFRYAVVVEEDSDGTTPRIVEESLVTGIKNPITLFSGPDSSDRLALARLSRGAPAKIREFWRRAVFLRLNPSSLAEGSLPKRPSSAPILDEEGATLPALLSELTDDQRESLVKLVQDVLPGMRGVEVSKPRGGRSERVHYELLEEMKYKGRAGQKTFPIPAWMLSEGTRRLTAILALLVREPAPSLLCIEEVENGLDPWAVRILLRHLREASERGIQIIVTTHSPWVLDEVGLDDIILVRRVKGDSAYEAFSEVAAVQAFRPNIPAGTRYTHLVENEDDA